MALGLVTVTLNSVVKALQKSYNYTPAYLEAVLAWRTHLYIYCQHLESLNKFTAALTSHNAARLRRKDLATRLVENAFKYYTSYADRFPLSNIFLCRPIMSPILFNSGKQSSVE